MSLFDALYNEHAVPEMTSLFGSEVVSWTSGQEIVTAYQLSTGRAFTGMFEAYDAERDDKFGVANKILARLWVPLDAQPKQQDQWSVFFVDGRQVEYTCVCYGKQSGGFQSVDLALVDVTRFERIGLQNSAGNVK